MSDKRSSPVTLAKFRAEVRRAVADYMRSEGCSCCRNSEAHKEHTLRLGKLLKVPVYKDWYGNDDDGYDFSKYQTNPDA